MWWASGGILKVTLIGRDFFWAAVSIWSLCQNVSYFQNITFTLIHFDHPTLLLGFLDRSGEFFVRKPMLAVIKHRIYCSPFSHHYIYKGATSNSQIFTPTCQFFGCILNKPTLPLINHRKFPISSPNFVIFTPLDEMSDPRLSREGKEWYWGS